MKKVMFLLLSLPCLLVFNGREDTLWINLVGMCYIFGLWWMTSKTARGRRFFREVYRSLSNQRK